MNADVKTKWLEALKSGEYTKCTGQLRKRSPKGEWLYCALGVLADIQGVKWQGEVAMFPTVPHTGGLSSDLLIELDMLEDTDGHPRPDLMVSHYNDEFLGWDKVINYIERNL